MVSQTTSRVLAFVLLFCWGHAQEYAMEGEEYELLCVPEESSPSAQVVSWLLHGQGRAYEPGYSDDTISVLPDGRLHFQSVRVDHEGSHLCMRMIEGTTVGNPVPMMVRPLPPQDMWDEVYKSQFITGLVAAIICAFLFAAGCMVFKYRYREPKSVRLNGEEAGHINPTLDVEEDPNTKM